MIRNILSSIENENTLCKMVLFAILIPFSMKWWMIEAPVNVHIIFLPLASSKIVGMKCVTFYFLNQQIVISIFSGLSQFLREEIIPLIEFLISASMNGLRGMVSPFTLR